MIDLTGITVAHPGGIPVFTKTAEHIEFLNNLAAKQSLNTLVVSYPVGPCDPLLWFNAHRHSFEFNYYWEQPSETKTIASLGAVCEWRQSDSGRFASLKKAKTEALKHTAHLNKSNIGNYGFPLAGAFSFFDEAPTGSWQGFPAGALTLPRFTIFRQGDNCTASVAVRIKGTHSVDELHRHIKTATEAFPSLDNSGGYSTSSISSIASTNVQANEDTSYQQWEKMITKAKAAIDAGNIRKVVLARALQLQFKNPPDLGLALRHLRAQYPRCYTFLYKRLGSGTFIGSTPELLLSTEGPSVRTEALAGSMARGQNKTEDARRGACLLENRKDRKEHQFVKKQIIKRLGTFIDDLQYPHHPLLKKLSNVQHLFTPIRGNLREEYEPLNLVKALHPTPAVGGVPRDRSLQFIRKNELLQRGLFAAPVGWISSNRHAEFAVALRSGLINDRTARLFAGCGIVADSNPQQEWEESELKFRPMLSALNYD